MELSSGKVDVVDVLDTIHYAFSPPVEMKDGELSTGESLLAAWALLELRVPALGASGKQQCEVKGHTTVVLLRHYLKATIPFGDDQIVLPIDSQEADLFETHLLIVPTLMLAFRPSLGRDHKPPVGQLLIWYVDDLTEVPDIGVAGLQGVLQGPQDRPQVGLLPVRNANRDSQVGKPCGKLQTGILYIQLGKDRSLTVSSLQGSSILVNLALDYDAGTVAWESVFIGFQRAEAEAIVDRPNVLQENLTLGSISLTGRSVE